MTFWLQPCVRLLTCLAAQHQLEVNTTLEDIVGNRLTGLFDRPIAKDGFNVPAPDLEVLISTPH